MVPPMGNSKLMPGVVAVPLTVMGVLDVMGQVVKQGILLYASFMLLTFDGPKVRAK